jgi:hypothetical protein
LPPPRTLALPPGRTGARPQGDCVRRSVPSEGDERQARLRLRSSHRGLWCPLSTRCVTRRAGGWTETCSRIRQETHRER